MKNEISAKQLFANRENAKKSSGPSTPAGRKGSSMNALTHSFAGQTVIVPEHEVDAYQKLFADFHNEYLPVGPTETFLVHSMADLTFSVQQIRTVSTNRMYLAGARSFPNGNDTHTPQTENSLAQAFSATELAPTYNNLGIYEARKMRLFHNTRRELIAIQIERKAREKEELEAAAELREADKKNRQPDEKEWHPSENGFVCSLAEIDRYLYRINRRDQLLNPAKTAA
jgi:hypothetical protein